MSPTRKDTPITNPNDPRFKLQNEIQILASIIDIATLEVTRQRWIQEERIKATLIMHLKKKRELETAPVEDKPAKQDKREQSSKNAAEHFLDVISNLKISIQNTISHARDEAIKAVDAQIKDPVTNAMAKNIVAKVFNNQLVQQSSDLLQNVVSNKFTLDAELAKAHPCMHELIKEGHKELQSAVETGDSQKALKGAFRLQVRIGYGQEVQTATQRKIFVVDAAKKPTPQQMLEVEQENANTIRMTSPNVAWVGYADKKGKFAEVEVKDGSQLMQVLKDASRDPVAESRKKFYKLLDDIAARKGATPASERVKARIQELRTLFITSIDPIADNAATQIMTDLSSATEQYSRFVSDGTKKTSSHLLFPKADGTQTDTLGNANSSNQGTFRRNR